MLGTVVLGTGLFVTRSDYGREWLRSTIEAQLARGGEGEGAPRPDQRRLPHRRHDRLGGAARRSGLAVRGGGPGAREVRSARPRGPAHPPAARGRAGRARRAATEPRLQLELQADVQAVGSRQAEGTRARLRRLRGDRLGASPQRAAATDDAVASRRHAAGGEARQRHPHEPGAQGPRDPPHGRRILGDLSVDGRIRRGVAHAPRRSGQRRAALPRRHDARGGEHADVPMAQREGDRAPARRLGVDRGAALGPPGLDGSRGWKDHVGKRPPRALRHPDLGRLRVAERRGVGVSDAAPHGRRHDDPRHQERAEPQAARLRHHRDGRAHHEVAAARRHDVRGGRSGARRARREAARRSGRLRSAARAERQAVPRRLAGDDHRNGERARRAA